MKRLALLALVVPLLVLVPACGDDDPTGPQSVDVTVRVIDAAGDPVDGLVVGLLSYGPWLQDGPMASATPAKAAVALRFEMPQSRRAVLTVRDIEGTQVCTLVDAMLPAGRHEFQWIGRDDAGREQPSGRYTARFVALEEDGTQVFEQSRDMLLARLDVPVGETDADGELVLRDRKLFPHFYDRPDMMMVDESGDVMGTLELGATMVFVLSRLGVAGFTTHHVEVAGAGDVIDLVWDPAARVAAGTARPVAVTPPALDAGVPPTDGYELHHPIPNPFN